ncbi:MAG: hypothetical protein JWM89_768, partial [Acidimicrobiales bacterium]|nr:hypothetical protein [Acidimicrobiales bacterium]
WQRVLEEVLGALDGLGAANMGLMTSPLRGADGNVEFLLHARAPGGGASARDADALIEAALSEATAAEDPA